MSCSPPKDLLSPEDIALCHPKNRLATFRKLKWRGTRDDVSCSPTALANAGFIAITARCCKCYFCFKELENWEDDEDPWEEHRKHCPQCPLVKFYKVLPQHLTVLDAGKLLKERALYAVRLNLELVRAAYQTEETTRKPPTRA